MQVLVKQVNFVNATRGKIHLRKAIQAHFKGVSSQQVTLLAQKALRYFEALPTFGPEELSVRIATGDANFFLAKLAEDHQTKTTLLETARNIYDSIGSTDAVSLLHLSECLRAQGCNAARQDQDPSRFYRDAASYLFLALSHCPNEQSIHQLFSGSELPMHSEWVSSMMTGGEPLVSLITIFQLISENPGFKLSRFYGFLGPMLQTISTLRLSNSKTPLETEAFALLVDLFKNLRPVHSTKSVDLSNSTVSSRDRKSTRPNSS